VSLDRIWAGWRAPYIEGVTSAAASEACLLCELAELPDGDALILERTALTFTLLNAYPYTSGHLMVAPVRHEGDLEGLGVDEATALMVATRRAVVALKAAFRPEGLNLGVNLGRAAGAGVPGHLHLHALPRWGGDSNFMTAVAEARVLPEDLRTSWERLRAAWPS